MSTLQSAYESVLETGHSETVMLHEISVASWQQLAIAAESSDHPWRIIALCSIDNDEPQVRSVILRSANPGDRSITIHTDIRSPKARQIQARRAISCLCYDPASKIQLRLHGEATIRTSGRTVDRVWQELPDVSRRHYLTKRPPGEFTTTALCERFGADHVPLSGEADAFARGNFALIECHILRMEWLYLREGGDLRASFDHDGPSASERWLVP